MFWVYASMVLLIIVGLLLMIVILLQRGRGGGLAGAFGGLGGQSAFGTRAGDMFTKITAGMAIVWVVLAGASRFVLESYQNQMAESQFESGKEEPGIKGTGEDTEAGDTTEGDTAGEDATSNDAEPTTPDNPE